MVKMTVFNNIWQAYFKKFQVSLILPLTLIIAANVGVVASTIEEIFETKKIRVISKI